MEKTQTNKEKILSTLFESPKTTAQISEALGYNKRYNVVVHDLQDLMKKNYIKSKLLDKEYTGRGKRPTQYSINPKLIIAKKILEDYPGLLLPMFKNDDIQNNLAWVYKFDAPAPDFKERLRASPSCFEFALTLEKSDFLERSKEMNELKEDPEGAFKHCLLNDILNDSLTAAGEKYFRGLNERSLKQ